MLNGKLCCQLDIFGVLNINLGAQQEIIMYSTGHYWGAQWEVVCSTRNYNVLNWTLLGCSMGHYWVLIKELDTQWEIIMHSTGHYLGAQQEVRYSTGS